MPPYLPHARVVPERRVPIEALLRGCRAALKRAHGTGKNSIVTAEERDFS